MEFAGVTDMRIMATKCLLLFNRQCCVDCVRTEDISYLLDWSVLIQWRHNLRPRY